MAIGLTLASVACGPDAAEEQAATPAEQPAGDSMAGMGGMAMGGASGMQMGTEMMAHMQGMQTMHADSVMKMMPMHRQMLGNMLAQMDREMQGMSKPADPAWTALADSLRDDQVRMPAMTAAEMEASMPAHHGRVTRLMEMHRAMMGPM